MEPIFLRVRDSEGTIRTYPLSEFRHIGFSRKDGDIWAKFGDVCPIRLVKLNQEHATGDGVYEVIENEIMDDIGTCYYDGTAFKNHCLIDLNRIAESVIDRLSYGDSAPVPDVKPSNINVPSSTLRHLKTVIEEMLNGAAILTSLVSIREDGFVSVDEITFRKDSDTYLIYEDPKEPGRIGLDLYIGPGVWSPSDPQSPETDWMSICVDALIKEHDPKE